MAIAGPASRVDSAPAALEAYEPLASAYDDFTAAYRHDRWLAALERLALEHGLSGRRVLDVACGTGKSFMPLLARGYQVTACDLSPSMVAVARERLGGDPARAFVADMRALPSVAAFDLVTCLDDAVNYLLTEDDLVRALASMRATLRPGGLLAFDVNTLRTYRTTFARDAVDDRRGRFFCWRGHASADAAPGQVHAATLDVFTPAPEEGWRRVTSRHLQRHHPLTDVRRSTGRAGLTLLAVRGQLPGAILEGEADEERHTKLVFLATRKEM
ncbi:MAG: class I SAM-dependent methyltransferase [Thermoleophilaceae bacterium]